VDSTYTAAGFAGVSINTTALHGDDFGAQTVTTAPPARRAMPIFFP
jgi:hypothetical protein